MVSLYIYLIKYINKAAFLRFVRGDSMLAYLLINTEKGKEQDIYDKVTDFEEVIGCHIIFGEWDIIAKVEIENSEELGTIIMDKVRPIEGVSMTSTLIVAR